MDEVITYKDGTKYFPIKIKRCAQYRPTSSCFELKSRQEINGTKVKKSHDVWFQQYIDGDLGFFTKSIGQESVLYVHEKKYKTLKFVEV